MSSIHFLLVHGNWGDVWTWKFLARELAEQGYGITLLQNPDRATRDAAPRPSGSTADYTLKVSAAAEKIKADTGHYPVIVGHSLGAVLALQAAVRGKARALILAAPSLPSNLPQPLLSGANIRLFLPWLMGGVRRKTLAYPFKPTLAGTRCLLRGWPDEAVRQLHGNLQLDSGRILKEFALNSPAARVDPAAVSCPSLSIAGRVDEASPPTQVQKLAAAIRGEYMELDGHHFFMIEKNLVAPLVTRILSFVQALEQDAEKVIVQKSA